MKRRHYSNFFRLSTRKAALIFCACLLAAVAVPKLWAAASLPPDLITDAQGQAFEGEWIADFKARNAGRRYMPGSDGRTAASVKNSNGPALVWDIPPRQPGGIVLALLIVQVGLVTAWMARRCSRRRGLPAVTL